MPGPVPKRSDQRRRRNKPEGAQLAKAPAGDRPDMPDVSDTWHPVAAAWFRSLGESGQSEFYEASDWATAVYVAEAMSRNLQATRERDKESGEWVTVGRFSAQLFSSVMSAMTDLLTTEGARRRARIELERTPEQAPASVTALAEYRKAAGGS